MMAMPLRLLAALTLCVTVLTPLSAQDAAGPLNSAASLNPERVRYQKAMAAAVRAAAEPLWKYIVTVEVVGADESTRTEVRQDAPTSGWIIDPSGYILTSGLVAKRDAASILVRVHDGVRFAAEIVAEDKHRNLALLKVHPPSPLPAFKMVSGSSGDDKIGLNGLRVGQTTIALGRYGRAGAPLISTGILSAKSRLEGIAIQTDARISPSFYGGPLIDLNGQMLGIVIPAVAAGGAENETSWYDAGIAFAIPTAVILTKLERLKSGTNVRKGLIGIVPKSKDPYENETTIAAVRLRSPAAKAGLLAGDEIREVAGQKVVRFQQIKESLGPYDAGETVTIRFDRKGTSRSLKITLAESIPPLDPQRLGILASNHVVATPVASSPGDTKATPSKSIRIDDVVIDSAAEKVFQPGDRITQVADSSGIDLESLRRIVLTAEPGERLTFTRVRDDKTEAVEIIPESIHGTLKHSYPESWMPANEPEKEVGGGNSTPVMKWAIDDLKLPDSANPAAILKPIPPSAENGAGSAATDLGLLVVLCPPGSGDPDDSLRDWKLPAARAGVAVCAIASESSDGWKPKEIEVIGRYVAAAVKRAAISDHAIAIASLDGPLGGDATAADAMALAVAITESNRFSGVAVSPKTRPPGIRLKENDPSSPVSLLLPMAEDDELPSWGTALHGAGYPIIQEQELDRPKLLRWVRLLQSI